MFARAMRTLALVVAAVGLSFPALAQDDPAPGPILVVNITTDDVWSGQMGLGFARRVQEDGGDVIVSLTVRAVALANANVPQHTGGGSGKTPHELIADILDAGGRVFVCPGCTQQAGLSLDDRIEGTEPGSPEYRQIIMAPGTRIISF